MNYNQILSKEDKAQDEEGPKDVEEEPKDVEKEPEIVLSCQSKWASSKSIISIQNG